MLKLSPIIRSRWLVAAAAVAAVAATAALGQADRWYPSRWGAADQRGAANELTPAKVLEAKNLIKTGTVYQLGHVYESAMPLFGTRHFSLRIPQTFGPMGSNNMMYHDEVISGELGQIGTQFDGLGHIGIGDLFYNGNDRTDFAKAEGLDEARRRERRRDRDARRADRRARRSRASRSSRAATRSRWPTSRARSRARRWRSTPATS